MNYDTMNYGELRDTILNYLELSMVSRNSP